MAKYDWNTFRNYAAFLTSENAPVTRRLHHDSELTPCYHDAFLPWGHYHNNIVLFYHNSPITRMHFMDPTDRAIKSFYCSNRDLGPHGIGSGNDLSSVQCQIITWANANILSTGPSLTKVSEIWIKIWKISLMKMYLKKSSVKSPPFCPGLNMLSHISTNYQICESQRNELRVTQANITKLKQVR